MLIMLVNIWWLNIWLSSTVSQWIMFGTSDDIRHSDITWCGVTSHQGSSAGCHLTLTPSFVSWCWADHPSRAINYQAPKHCLGQPLEAWPQCLIPSIRSPHIKHTLDGLIYIDHPEMFCKWLHGSMESARTVAHRWRFLNGTRPAKPAARNLLNHQAKRVSLGTWFVSWLDVHIKKSVPGGCLPKASLGILVRFV